MSSEFLSAGIDFERANAARMYDYFLGGAHNFAVDRELAERVIAGMPTSREWARGNRAFLRRVVEYCVGQGVRQFLDLGSGIPTAGHVHEIARAIAPETRVAYVDFEPVAVAHSQEILAGVDGVSVTRADVRDPASVLGAPTVRAVIDVAEPVAVLAAALVHFIADENDPAGILAAYRAPLVSGSFLTVTHASADQDDPELAAELERAAAVYDTSATPATLRDRDRIRELLGGLALVDPGLVDINRWRNDPGARPLGHYGAVARIP